jgi:hypothetical protein
MSFLLTGSRALTDAREKPVRKGAVSVEELADVSAQRTK